jgi:hypothetical protein
VTFTEAFGLFSWRPIPGCPGRYVLQGGLRKETFPELVSAASRSGSDETRMNMTGHRSAAAPDPVFVIRFEDGGGAISFRKPDGRYVHTLNTAEGFRRKLAMLGITGEDGDEPEREDG